MKLGLRLLLGFFLITGIAAFFILRIFALEVRPSVREVMEDMLVDTANILAELAHDDLAQMPAGGTLMTTRFAQNVRHYAARTVDARIWDLRKTTLDYRVYVTDATGRVVFDSGAPGKPSAVGQDYSRWHDVASTLAGQYGARATRDVRTDERSSVMYVAAPVRDRDRVLGVLTVAKPLSTVSPFLDRAEQKILKHGAILLGLSSLIGVAVTGWTVSSVRRLRHYAQEVQYGERREPPRLSGELGELALAMGAMRERLEGREHLEQTMRALTHELKSPMAAIAGAAELLQDDLPPRDRAQFATQIQEQVERQRRLVERMLELSKLEHLRALDGSRRLDLGSAVDAAVRHAQDRARQRRVTLNWTSRDEAPAVGNAELLELAISNLLENAIDFAPLDSIVELELARLGAMLRFSVRDHGPGVADYAMAQMGQRFFSTARPAGNGEPARRGSGLGLAIVRAIMALHGGRIELANAATGLRATLLLPTA